MSRRLQRETQQEFERVQVSIKTLLQKFLANSISKEMFDASHNELLTQRKSCEEKIFKLETDTKLLSRMQEFISRLRTLCERFCAGSFTEKRGNLDEVFERITVSGHDLRLSLFSLMAQIAARTKTTEGWQSLLPAILKELAADERHRNIQRGVLI